MGVAAILSHAQGTLQVGYTLVRLNTGTGVPVGTVVFSFTNDQGVLVTEAGVGAVARTRYDEVPVREVAS